MDELLKLLAACRSSVAHDRNRYELLSCRAETELVQDHCAAEAKRLQALLDRIDAVVGS